MTERSAHPVLTNPDLVPDDAQIQDALGTAFTAWRSLEHALQSPDFALTLSWRFYRDGGWLCRALKGSKNLVWLAVWESHATATFYFAARHRDGLAALAIPEDLRAQAAQAEMSGKLLPLVIPIRSQPDVDAALEILRYKLRAK